MKTRKVAVQVGTISGRAGLQAGVVDRPTVGRESKKPGSWPGFVRTCMRHEALLSVLRNGARNQKSGRLSAVVAAGNGRELWLPFAWDDRPCLDSGLRLHGGLGHDGRGQCVLALWRASSRPRYGRDLQGRTGLKDRKSNIQHPTSNTQRRRLSRARHRTVERRSWAPVRIASGRMRRSSAFDKAIARQIERRYSFRRRPSAFAKAIA